MAKSVSKSIRMTEEVNNYIVNYRGNGFNEKFSNIILDAMKEESERVKRLEVLDLRIETSKKKLGELCDQFDKLNPHLQVALGLHTKIKQLRVNLEEII